MNRTHEELEADHDDPDAEGGPTDRENLHLSHLTCNRQKRNTPTPLIRPYLKILAFIKKKGVPVRYGDALGHFEVTPKPTEVDVGSDSVRFVFCDGSSRELPILVEHGRKEFKYVYVDVPRGAIYNDDDCQPRAIKPSQLWAIYNDLQENPLHEPPSCRLVRNGRTGTYRLLMFDGQHKTIASWMAGRERVVVKVYLDFDQHQAVRLVNSIQAKIRKLPLSPLEMTAKLSDEMLAQWARYESEAGEKASEAGFIQWLPSTQRIRGKEALREAILNTVLDSPELRLREYVNRAGESEPVGRITEAAFKTKVVGKLMNLQALPETGPERVALRERELDHVVRALNLFTESAFGPLDDPAASDSEKERARRMSYQSSLAYIASLIRAVFRGITWVEGGREMMAKDLDDEKWGQIEKAIKRLVDCGISWRFRLAG